MPRGPYSRSNFCYHQYQGKGQTVDVHDISVKKSWRRIFLSYIGSALFLASVFDSLLMREFCIGSVWSILIGILFAKVLQYKPVKKESVLIIPVFGVQLETHYWSGRIDRRFVPISMILKPVLNECVTPVTCYWSLALILRGKDDLELVFQKLRPPVQMLLPVWKALCAATDVKESAKPEPE